MKGDLYINGKDAFDTWGVNMGDGFLDALSAPLSMKENIQNESRTEHGKRVVVVPKIASREITLGFTIMGTSESDYKAKKQSFFDELYNGELTINVPQNGDEVYHLVYLGKSTSFAQNKARTFCKMAMKFDEPNPMERS